MIPKSPGLPVCPTGYSELIFLVSHSQPSLLIAQRVRIPRHLNHARLSFLEIAVPPFPLAPDSTPCLPCIQQCPQEFDENGLVSLTSSTNILSLLVSYKLLPPCSFPVRAAPSASCSPSLPKGWEGQPVLSYKGFQDSLRIDPLVKIDRKSMHIYMFLCHWPMARPLQLVFAINTPDQPQPHSLKIHLQAVFPFLPTPTIILVEFNILSFSC